uniref:Pacifastin domain-containing protein n=1 Tax=Trichogramma kaykai TaxID=54128 RepID=A0ABD2XDG2_9HYME
MRFITVVFFAAVIAFAAAYEITESNPKFGAMVAQAQSLSERLKRAPVEALCPIKNNYKVDACNWCYCDPTNGHTSCGRKPCPKETPTTTTTEPPSEVSDTCPEGTRFKRDCNECTCEPELGITQCTTKSCPRTERPEFSGNY